jgi:diguanylate cyclase (GGDEF)-like protein
MIRKNIREFLWALKIILSQGSGIVFRDQLTNLYNRKFFNEIAKKEIARSKRHQHPLSCALIDIDRFKEINDTYGHQEGDRVLKNMGRLILKTCRESDIPVRWGGDEFLLLLPETKEKQAHDLMKRIIKESDTSISYGIADCLKHPSIEEAISAADQKMYLAKKE